MNATLSLQFFFDSVMEESLVISLINNISKLGFESLSFNVENSVGFIQTDVYEQGYRQGFLMTWPKDKDVGVSGEELAVRIANSFSVRVLMELGPGHHDWILVRPGEGPEKVAPNYLDDGVEVAQTVVLP
ncbi:hypothetical protein [Deinococcus altitudinis]|uniref:hypothetical protein n=1 Tax=Deinococcus altitudinis TaxID=468914 RepID=UPI00389147A9